MSTRSKYPREEITTGNRGFSTARTTIETAFYGNNVENMVDLKKAYEMAKVSSGTIETDMPVFEPEKIGLPEGAKILLLMMEQLLEDLQEPELFWERWE